MGGNRRNRGGNSSHNHHKCNKDKTATSGSSPRKVNRSNASIRDPYQQKDVVLAEIEHGLSVSFKDLCYFGFAILVMLAYGGVAGIAAGTSISVHYFEKSLSERRPTRASLSAQFGLMPNPSASRITSFHSASLSANKLLNGMSGLNHKKKTTTGVLPSTSFESVEVLMLVEESIPLGTETTFDDPACSDQDESGSCLVDDSFNASEQTDGSSPKLSTAQAKLFVAHYDEWLKLQPKFQPPDPVIKPTICQDGSSGFDSWKTLRNAIHEANSINEERSALWSSYYARDSKYLPVFNDDRLYYEEDMVFRICPGETLRSRRGPITVNAANLILECEDCTLEIGGGTHFAFGPRARNALMKGITFRGATASSLSFFHHGSDAIFEDCTWIGNTGASKKTGGVADINSTSAVKFYRCSIGSYAQGSSSLSIRA